ncbi:MAG TPA: hypothetical protein VH278_05400 [Burkholderiaceae bacterium]|jgi:hypothetical protein|nr:hypothetical protein [Burkholderiaceae bacterium]
MQLSKQALLFLLLTSALSVLALARAAGVRADDGTVYRPTGKGWGEIDESPGAADRARTAQLRNHGTGIYYHGGPLLDSPAGANAYAIWYGNWSGNSALTILPDMLGHIGGSPYFNINTTYYDGSQRHVVNAVTFMGSTTDSYSQGSALSDSGVEAVVSRAISSGALPKDTNGVYFVLTSADVNETSGFCTQYCGWHTSGSIAGSDIKFAFIGNPDRCPSACEAQTTSPNGNSGADGMANIIGHELEEAVTDPDLNAWYDNRGYENADKCAWTFGNTSTAPNGSHYNMTLGSREYLIQRNWVNAGSGGCALSY